MIAAISAELESRGIYTVTRGNSLQTVSASEYLEALASEDPDSWLTRMKEFVKRNIKAIAGGGFLFTAWYGAMLAMKNKIKSRFVAGLNRDFARNAERAAEFGSDSSLHSMRFDIDHRARHTSHEFGSLNAAFVAGCVAIVAVVLGAVTLTEIRHRKSKEHDAQKLARAHGRVAKVQALHSEFKALAAKAKKG